MPILTFSPLPLNWTVFQLPLSLDFGWGSAGGNPSRLGSGRGLSRDFIRRTYGFATPFLYIDIFPFILNPHSLSFLPQAALLVSFMCMLLFVRLFVKCTLLFCMHAFSAYSSISIPALGFAIDYIAVGASGVWLLTALSLMVAIFSLCPSSCLCKLTF